MTRDAERWQLDGRAPELYERYLVPAMTAHWASDLVERIDIRRGQSVLDVACGTGVVARAAAPRVGDGGTVAALDLNPGMLAVARALPPVGGAAVAWHEGNALALPFADASFEVVLCQFGLQFFPDRPTALAEMSRVLLPGGRAGLSVFSAIDRNPATNAISDALDRRLYAGASLAKRNEHSLADVDALSSLIADAGFDAVRVDTVTKTISFPSAEHYVRAQFAATPLAGLLEPLDEEEQRRVLDDVVRDVRRALASYADDSGLRFPQEAHVVRAVG